MQMIVNTWQTFNRYTVFNMYFIRTYIDIEASSRLVKFKITGNFLLYYTALDQVQCIQCIFFKNKITIVLCMKRIKSIRYVLPALVFSFPLFLTYNNYSGFIPYCFALYLYEIFIMK